MTSPSSLLHRLRCAGVSVFFGTVTFLVGEAATLPFDATLHIQPDEDAPIVGTVTSGASIIPLLREDLNAAGVQAPPSGWIATRSPGPFNGFVRNQDVEANGLIRAGAEIHVQPLADAPLLLVVEAGDQTEAREPIGDWSRATIRTELIVYVNALPPASRRQVEEVPPMVATEPVVVAAPAPAKPKKVKPAKAAKPPREPKPEPVVEEAAGAPRVFEGYLLHTRRFLGLGPKFNYELVDENNHRIALLDLSGLLATSPLDTFESRRVSVYGPGIKRSDVDGLIIRVERLRLSQ